MTREERKNVLHCLKSIIDEEVCEECDLYGTTGTDHCEKDCVRMAIEALEDSEWIPCSERLPEEKINPITQDFYEYQCTYHIDEIYDVRHYKFGKGHWWHGAGIMDDCVTAWRELPKPYQGDK